MTFPWKLLPLVAALALTRVQKALCGRFGEGHCPSAV